MRIGAGEAIALIYEGARQFDEDFGFDVSTEEEETDDHDGIQERDASTRQTQEMDELCTKLRQLATDSHKYRAKKDRKQQRSSFRDILRAIEVVCFTLTLFTDRFQPISLVYDRKTKRLTSA